MDYLTQGFLDAFTLLFSGDEETFSAVFTTLKISTASIFISLAAGLPLGFMLGYYTFPGKRQLRAFVDTLLALPTVVVGLLVYAFITQKGPLGGMGLLFELSGVVVAQVILVIPIIISLTATGIESLDERLKSTLLTLGARGSRIITSSLYEARFAIMAAGVNAYGRAIAEVGISMMIGGNIKWHTRTITTAIALETGKGQFSMGIALGIVLLLIGFTVNYALIFFKRRG